VRHVNCFKHRQIVADGRCHPQTAAPAEVKLFKYVNDTITGDPRWARLSATRLVADGVKNLDHVQSREIRDNVAGIATRLRQRARFPALIAARRGDTAELVLLEGHTRAIAYVLTDLPNEIDVFIGTSAHMASWAVLLIGRRREADNRDAEKRCDSFSVRGRAPSKPNRWLGQGRSGLFARGASCSASSWRLSSSAVRLPLIHSPSLRRSFFAVGGLADSAHA